MAKPYPPRITVDELMEFVSDESPAGGNASWTESAETIVFDIPGRYLYDAQILLLGYAWVAEAPASGSAIDPAEDDDETFPDGPPEDDGDDADDDPPDDDPTGPTGTSPTVNGPQVFLRRWLPLTHPYKPNLICTRLDNWKGIGPRGKHPSWQTAKIRNLKIPQSRYTSRYEVVRISAVFTQPPYEILPDSEVIKGNEVIRFTWLGQSPSANMITLDQGSMHFTEGDLIGKTFTAPGYAQSEVQQLIVLSWTNVPEEYVVNKNTLIPVRLAGALQKVNSEQFLGFKPGTLLMEPYKYTRYRMHLPDINAVAEFWADIEFSFRYFNPPYGVCEIQFHAVDGSTTLVGAIVIEGTPTVPAVQAGTEALTVGTKVLPDYGFPVGTTVTNISDDGVTVTMSNPWSDTTGDYTIGFERSRYGHLTAPRAPNLYFDIATNNGLQRYQAYDFNNFFYPLTNIERNS